MSSETAGYIERFKIADDIHGEVACVEIGPRRDASLPVCLFLYGGGGTCESLLELAPLLDQAWQRGTLPACRVITPNVAPWSFYLDDREHGSAWESFVSERLLAQLQGDFGGAAAIPEGMAGISMGGYGAPKMAFARPSCFRAVAAVAPMVEPSFTAAAVRPRNRYHYPPEVPEALLGPQRNASLYAADHPACRAVRHAEALRNGGPAVYLDAGTADALNAHDGAEFLHRVLWELDIEHDYHLWKGADHVGPTLLPRLEAAFCWVASKLIPLPVALTSLELEWQRWLDAGATGPTPPPLSPISPLMPRLLRTMLAPLHEAARSKDETLNRRFGVLPAASAPAP